MWGYPGLAWGPATNRKFHFVAVVVEGHHSFFDIPAPVIEVGIQWSHFFLWRSQNIFVINEWSHFFVTDHKKKCDRHKIILWSLANRNYRQSRCIVPKGVPRRIIITQQSSRSAPTNQTHQLNSSEAYQKLSFGFVVVLPQLLSQLIRSAVP